MTRHKFYKYKMIDMLFATSLKAFPGACILAITGTYILINELKKLML